jgi:hypothetical protein
MASNTYTANTKAAEAAFSVGEFEHEFTVAEERDWLASGLISLVPRTYRVLTDTRVHETGLGDTFEAAMPIEIEAALIDGGHIERVSKTAKKPKEAKK